ncbi:KH domain-containing protein [Granulicella mallensis]|uniref:KH domain-containing protein n=1 Tax=Granulicella mallensis TaxID=940614 RepID=UPI0029529474|nr:KH domain-containing protein [Granulicella mallensis]
MTEKSDPNPNNSAISNMQSLMLEIARALVDDPEAVHVDASDAEGSTVLRLRVAPNDIGKVIGKQGRTARCLRTILGAASMKHRHRFSLDIIEAEGDKAAHVE